MTPTANNGLLCCPLLALIDTTGLTKMLGATTSCSVVTSCQDQQPYFIRYMTEAAQVRWVYNVNLCTISMCYLIRQSLHCGKAANVSRCDGTVVKDMRMADKPSCISSAVSNLHMLVFHSRANSIKLSIIVASLSHDNILPINHVYRVCSGILVTVRNFMASSFLHIPIYRSAGLATLIRIP